MALSVSDNGYGVAGACWDSNVYQVHLLVWRCFVTAVPQLLHVCSFLSLPYPFIFFPVCLSVARFRARSPPSGACDGLDSSGRLRRRRLRLPADHGGQTDVCARAAEPVLKLKRPPFLVSPFCSMPATTLAWLLNNYQFAA